MTLSLRGASPLGLPFTLSREPLRRLAPFAWLTSLRSLASLYPRPWPPLTASARRRVAHFAALVRVSLRTALTAHPRSGRRRFLTARVAPPPGAAASRVRARGG